MSADPYADQVARRLGELLDRYRDDLPETLWMTSLTMIDRATDRTRNCYWWRAHPDGELRRLRGCMAEALALARFAAALQTAENDAEHEITRELREAAAAVGQARRRAQTQPATAARVEKRRLARAARAHAPDPSGDDAGGA
jgi:hypothetical protein